jgi:hypothetical protein
MSLIDRTLISRKSSHTIKPWWEICIYCTQPFTTDTFEKTCQRCKFFDKYKDEFSAKVMLKFIFFSTLIALTNSTIAIYLSKYLENIYHLLFLYVFINLLIGTIFYRVVKN